MDVIIPTIFTGLPLHIETELEIAQRHLSAGDDVTFLVCKGDVPACDFNVDHSVATCLRCIGYRKDGLHRLEESPHLERLLSLEEQDRKTLSQLPDSFENREELEQFMVETFDAGQAVVSTLVSMKRKLELDLSEAGLGPTCKDLLHSAVATFLSVQNHIDRHRPDRVYVFNGRLALLRAVLRACQEREVDCYVHESGCDRDHFTLYKNALPHDRGYVEKEIHRYWKEAEADERRRIAESFYEERAHGQVPDHSSYENYVSEQDPELLPEGFDSTQHNVVVYPSSQDEFEALGPEWENPIYQDQIDGIKAVARDLRTDDGIHLYVRVHPNLKEVQNRQTEELASLKIPGCTVIPPNSPISTYALLGASDVALTFGSTMGIEATYWRVPSVLAGMSLYRNIGGVYTPESHSDVLDLLSEEQLLPKPLKPALKYGYYQGAKGMKKKHFGRPEFVNGNSNRQSITSTPSLFYRVTERLSASPKLNPVWRQISEASRRRARRNVEV